MSKPLASWPAWFAHVERIERRRRRRRRLGLGMGGMAGILLAGIVIDGYWPLPMAGLLLVDAALLAVGAGMLAAMRRPRLDRWRRARRIEQSLGCMDQTLSNAVALADDAEAGRGAVSGALRDRVNRRADAMVGGLAPARWAGGSRGVWAMAWSAAALGVALGVWAWRLDMAGAALARLARPWAALPPYALTQVELVVDGATPLEGSRVRVTARVRPAAVEAAMLLIEEEGQRTDMRPMSRRASGQSTGGAGNVAMFDARVAVGRRATRLAVAAGDGRSRWVRLEPVAVPRPARLLGRVQPPVGMGLPARLLALGEAPASAPPDSVVAVTMIADLPLAGGTAQWRDEAGVTEAIALTPDGMGGLAGQFVVARSGRLRVEAWDSRGVRMTPGVEAAITAVAPGKLAEADGRVNREAGGADGSTGAGGGSGGGRAPAAGSWEDEQALAMVGQAGVFIGGSGGASRSADDGGTPWGPASAAPLKYRDAVATYASWASGLSWARDGDQTAKQEQERERTP